MSKTKHIDFASMRVHRLYEGRRLEKCPLCGKTSLVYRFDPRLKTPSTWEQLEHYVHSHDVNDSSGLFRSISNSVQCGRYVPVVGDELEKRRDERRSELERILDKSKRDLLAFAIDADPVLLSWVNAILASIADAFSSEEAAPPRPSGMFREETLLVARVKALYPPAPNLVPSLHSPEFRDFMFRVAGAEILDALPLAASTIERPGDVADDILQSPPILLSIMRHVKMFGEWTIREAAKKAAAPMERV